jgi:hypothetical protein
MSSVSNHEPEVIDEANGTQEGRPRDWDPDEDIILEGPPAV